METVRRTHTPGPFHVSLPYLLVLLLASTFLTSRAWAQTTETPDAKPRIHVTYWEKWLDFEEKAMRTSVDQFNRSQDRIQVDYFPVSQIDRKTIVAIAGGDPPDIAGLWSWSVASFADAEALMPFDDFIRKDGQEPSEWLGSYYPVFSQMCQHYGKVYAGISTPGVIAFHWNKTLFREAGLDPERPPRTLAELEEFSRRLTRRDPATGAITQMGFLPQEPDWWPWSYSLWFGGELFDGREITLTKDPRNLAALRWVQSMNRFYGKDAVTRFVSGFGPMASPQSAFFSGKVAMVIQGVWYNRYIKEYSPGLDYGVAPAWPSAEPGVDDFAIAEADVLVIPRGARHPQEAWEFIQFLHSSNLRARSQEELSGVESVCYLQEKTSPLREWSPFFEQKHLHPHIKAFRKMSASPNTACVPDMGIWQEYQREFGTAFSRSYLLLTTPEEAIDYAQGRLERSWARHRQSLIRHGQFPEPQEKDPR